jgi:glycine dehydrogenase subunit 1
MAFTPHTEADIQGMLAAIGAASLDELFDEIPASLRAGPLQLAEGLSEMETVRHLRRRAAQNRPLTCFAGAGAYEHYIPAAVWEIAQRGEFYSAYTPYQPEASQGTLQVLYEFQTMMASLMGLDVSNASLYDGASALAEAILMALRANPKARRVLIPITVNPVYRRVAATLIGRQGIELAELPLDPATGRMSPETLDRFEPGSVGALVIPQPNYFGLLEDVDALSDAAHRLGALVIGLVNPVAMALLQPPGAWGEHGADIACGDGQPLGAPLSGGGPYFGFLCCRRQWVHHLPGRLVGAATDLEGKPGFTLTLQAREQHIRRGKATSNICTNQGLMATAATIHMALLGPEGLRRVALQCHDNTRKLRDRLCAVSGVEAVFQGPFFHETALRLPRPAGQVLAGLAERGILGGCDLSGDYPELKNCLLVCATEMRNDEDIEAYAQALTETL